MQNNFFVIPPLNDTSNFALETALILSKNNLVALYNYTSPINIFRLISNEKLFQRVKQNLYEVRPFHLLPFNRFSQIYRLNQTFALLIILFWGILIHKKKSAVFWLLHPSLVWIVRSRGFLHFFKPKFLYDCVDFFSIDYEKSLSKIDKTALRNELEILKKSDIVTANSYTLFQYCKKIRRDVFLVPQGFSKRNFSKQQVKNCAIFDKKRPIIGYVGGINKRLDTTLLAKLITQNPQWTFVLWGPIQDPIPFKLRKLLNKKNVITGSSKKQEVGEIIRQFDVAIIPYSNSIFNAHSLPVKLFEYFYCGKPVVSSPIKELGRYSKYVSIAKSAIQWEDKLSFHTTNSWNKALVDEQRKIAISHSWNNKIVQTELALKGVL